MDKRFAKWVREDLDFTDEEMKDEDFVIEAWVEWCGGDYGAGENLERAFLAGYAACEADRKDEERALIDSGATWV